MIPRSGFVTTDHRVTVPLDHSNDIGPSIKVAVREVVAVGKEHDDLPALLFLQGGPGMPSPAPTVAWLERALQTYRVFLLDQRGTGRSTPITPATTAGRTADELASYLPLFRADSIVRDAEVIRRRLIGDKQWDSLGQSYGGFITLTYLSLAPEGLRRCLVTGGLAGLTATADDVYARTLPRVARRNIEYYQRFPEDRAVIRRLADRLEAEDVRLPDGDRLTAQRLRIAGSSFGMSTGFDGVHWELLDDDSVQDADAPQLSDRFRYEVMERTGFVDSPLYAMQEYCYAQGHQPTAWAAQRRLDTMPEFALDADPLLFTGETMFPWMFDEIRALRPFRDAAHLLADATDWSPLYDVDRLADNDVPLVAAVYFDDLYVDADLSLDTARRVGNARVWVTNEHEHDGLRVSPDVLAFLLDMADGRR